jgi:DNA end-binding protein Ku
VKLFPAIREDEGIHFHFLHGKDRGRIRNVRKCERDGKEVAWSEIVRGFEYAKGEYLVVSDEELQKLRPEKTQSVEIEQFVDLAEIEPMLFDRPYYLQPERSGRHAYALLGAALEKTGKVGIALVVLRSRQYLAAVKPSGGVLVLQTMHFATEVLSPRDLELPPAKDAKAANGKTRDREMKSALMLIDAMVKPFDAASYRDTFHDELRDLLEKRAQGAPLPAAAKAKAPRGANVVDLVAVLEKSLEKRRAGRARVAPAGKPRELGPRSARPRRAAKVSRAS